MFDELKNEEPNYDTVDAELLFNIQIKLVDSRSLAGHFLAKSSNVISRFSENSAPKL